MRRPLPIENNLRNIQAAVEAAPALAPGVSPSSAAAKSAGCSRRSNPAFADSTSRHAARLQPSNVSSPRSSACPETPPREHPADSDGAPSSCAAKSIPRNAQTILRTQSASRFLPGTPRGNRRTRIGKPRRRLQGLAVPGAAFRRRGSGVGPHGCGPTPSPSNSGCGQPLLLPDFASDGMLAKRFTIPGSLRSPLQIPTLSASRQNKSRSIAFNGRFLAHASICPSPWTTELWSRSPKAAPICATDLLVVERMMWAAIYRARTAPFVREPERMTSNEQRRVFSTIRAMSLNEADERIGAKRGVLLVGRQEMALFPKHRDDIPSCSGDRTDAF